MKPNTSSIDSLDYPINIQHFLQRYKFHIHFIIDRYGIPIKKEDWLKTQGKLITNIIDQHIFLKNRIDLINFFIFLIFNAYIIGPRMIRLFFVEIFDDSPRYSENGLRMWENLIENCTSILKRNVTYFDIIARQPVQARMDTFRRNVKRVLTYARESESGM